MNDEKKKEKLKNILVALPFFLLIVLIAYESFFKENFPKETRILTTQNDKLKESAKKASIYDEINEIKREDSNYDDTHDSKGNVTAKIKDAPLDVQMALSPWRVKGANNLVGWSQPFIGDKVDPDFGNSKYDKRLTADDLLYSGRSLEDIRAERRNEEIKKITINAIIGIMLICFIIFLLRRSNYFKSKSNETNK